MLGRVGWVQDAASDLFKVDKEVWGFVQLPTPLGAGDFNLPLGALEGRVAGIVEQSAKVLAASLLGAFKPDTEALEMVGFRPSAGMRIGEEPHSSVVQGGHYFCGLQSSAMQGCVVEGHGERGFQLWRRSGAIAPLVHGALCTGCGSHRARRAAEGLWLCRPTR